MKAIVMIDKNGYIGRDNNQVCTLKEDLKNFKKLTENNIVICGRKTLETFPNGKPLPNRYNYILSNNISDEGENYKYVTLDQLEEILKTIDTTNVWVIGGRTVYTQLSKYIDEFHITKCDVDFASLYEDDIYDENDFPCAKCVRFPLLYDITKFNRIHLETKTSKISFIDNDKKLTKLYDEMNNTEVPYVYTIWTRVV